ncbi:hypothetical protein [Luteimonas sp. MC1572]|uniref:hypothetical protein n=1 Tax=Luteimonas sp. MC1572 TaxID=2799325 RepID=UPI0018F0EEC3|nr:hypothetical protein [Luteimonas sp. MC1572]MBJ6981109.1 hypothetical protein [Luteimonas sp. MC1572]QQO02443.1 hypothetical protein JGR64_09615 [Luteimonas sp. MC1572]
MSVEPSKKGFRERLPWTIAAIAVVALVANLVWGQKDRGRPDDDAIAQLTERMAALETGGAERAPRRAAQRVPGARLDGADGDQGSALGRTQSPEEAAADRDRQLRELEAQFARDVADPVTGPKTESLLVKTISGETMAGTGLTPTNVDIACKKDSCRIVGSFDRMGDAQDWGLFYITAAGGSVLSQTQMVFVPKPDGRTEVRIYSARAKG